MGGRKRFVKTPKLVNPEEWVSELTELKQSVLLNSSFQLVGSKVYMEGSPEGLALMLEVIGVPVNLDQFGLVLVDQEASELLVHDLGENDFASVSLDSLLATSKGIQTALSMGENRLSPVFHLVLDKEKIELHFFRQKDYIQNLL